MAARVSLDTAPASGDAARQAEADREAAAGARGEVLAAAADAICYVGGAERDVIVLVRDGADGPAPEGGDLILSRDAADRAPRCAFACVALRAAAAAGRVPQAVAAGEVRRAHTAPYALPCRQGR